MIDKEEIENKAREFEINSSNVQRDYVFGWFLFGLYTQSDLKNTFFLKGGNALRKCYFENTRYSSDLDFGIPTDIDASLLKHEVTRICLFIQEQTGISFEEGQEVVEEKFNEGEEPLPDLKVYEIKIYFSDFYGNADHIKIKISMDLTRYDRTILEIQELPLIHPYSDADKVACTVRCMKLEEIIATKLKCLMQRQHAPDLYDYVKTIEILGATLDTAEMERVLLQKTIFRSNPHTLKEILISTPFDYFKNSWSKVKCAKQAFLEVDYAISKFKELIEDLFDGYAQGTRNSELKFFPGNFRHEILESGRKQQLLEITYKGTKRRIEPYSLKFMQKRSGEQQEYLYAYCVEGGSGEGSRMYVPQHTESVSLTEESYVPRWQVELSKSGEEPENKYLFDPNRPERVVQRPRGRKKRTHRTASRSTFSIKYVYQCSYCGKKFTRRKMGSKLNAHKSKDGFPCGGRVGFYVDTKY